MKPPRDCLILYESVYLIDFLFVGWFIISGLEINLYRTISIVKGICP